MEAKHLRLFVCSDFHAFDGQVVKDNAPSWFDIHFHGDAARCPVTQLQEYIFDHKLKADIAICCGDLGDKANPVAATTAWKSFQAIAGVLKSDLTVATAGNHDLDSHYVYNDFDAKGHMQILKPLFPSEELGKFDQYWSRHFYITESSDYRIVSLNSSAYHGSNDESKHGRVSARTLDALKKELTGREKVLVNILVCHHPPQFLAESQMGDKDFMKGGEDLAQFLGNDAPNQWLIIHGHKHYPRLQYARGGADAPVMLSAGSISAMPYQMYGKNGKNQVHFIDFDLSLIADKGFYGLVDTLEWTSADQWRPATRDGGLPARCGFGNRKATNEIAKAVARLVKGKIKWHELTESLPEVQYMVGNDLGVVLDLLEKQHGIGVSYDRIQEPTELVRK